MSSYDGPLRIDTVRTLESSAQTVQRLRQEAFDDAAALAPGNAEHGLLTDKKTGLTLETIMLCCDGKLAADACVAGGLRTWANSTLKQGAPTKAGGAAVPTPSQHEAGAAPEADSEPLSPREEERELAALIVAAGTLAVTPETMLFAQQEGFIEFRERGQSRHFAAKQVPSNGTAMVMTASSPTAKSQPGFAQLVRMLAGMSSQLSSAIAHTPASSSGDPVLGTVRHAAQKTSLQVVAGEPEGVPAADAEEKIKAALAALNRPPKTQ